MGAGRSGIFFFHNGVVLQMLRLMIEFEFTAVTFSRTVPRETTESNPRSIVHVDNLLIAMK